MAMKFSAFSQYLIGFMMQITECIYSVPVLGMTCRVTRCSYSLRPHALFLQPYAGRILQPIMLAYLTQAYAQKTFPNYFQEYSKFLLIIVLFRCSHYACIML